MNEPIRSVLAMVPPASAAERAQPPRKESHAPRPLGGPYVTLPVVILSVLVAIALYYIGKRFIFGIGAVAGINPGYPWGIWIVFDIVVGTAFGCGGYAMALLTYVFNQGKYHPLMRPAVLGGVFGYTLAGLAVMIDMGRYINAVNLFLPWYANLNSLMFETALCITFYFMVLWVEFSPPVLERFEQWFPVLQIVRKLVQKYMFVFAALGLLLPTLHQSTFGTMLIVTEAKLSHLWWTQLLPLLYLISAVGMGYAVVMFEATIVTRSFRLQSELPLLGSLSKVAMWLTLAFLAIRFGALAVEGSLALAFVPGLDALMFWIENGLCLWAVALVWTERNRRSERRVFLAAAALLVSGTLYRLDSYLVGYQGTEGWRYFPSVPEIMITVGVVSLEILLYILFVKFLPVLAGPRRHPAH
jgi:Ni/Fe-hydrogenase subunit HybB-like protein